MPSHRLALLFLLFLTGLCLSPPRAAQAEPSLPAPPGLTVAEALARAYRNRPEIKAFAADLKSAEVKRKQAALPPNPELGLELDNLGGALPADEVRETTLSLSQTIEVAGKPGARTNKVAAEILRLRHEQTTVWLDLAAEVKEAYLAVQSTRERLALQLEAEQIAKELADIIHERVAAGELAATEETRAEARRGEATAESKKAKRLQTEAELNLATLLSDPDLPIVTAVTGLTQEVVIPERQTLLAGVQDSPLLALRRSESKLAAAGLSLEQANAWSDPTLSLSVREIPDLDGRAVAVGVAIPLPFFQRNQTAIAEALATETKAAANETAAGLRLRTEVAKAHGTLVAAEQEAHTLRSEVLSRATEAAAAVREGFRAGKFRYSDVLESSHSLVAVKIRHLDAILDLHLAAIALDRLLGRPSLPERSQTYSSASHDRSNP